MAVYYVELSGGDIQPNASLSGGGISVANTLAGGDIYPGGSGGGASLVSTSVSYTPTAAGISDTLTPPTGYDGFDQVGVTVSGDADLVSGNIKNGVTIFGVTGTYSGGGASLVSTSVSYTPSETAISATLTPPTGYDGFDQVGVSVGAISSTYVGSGITQRTSSDLSASGATVTAPSGYYASSATKTIASAPTPTLNMNSVSASGTLDVNVDFASGGYVSAGTINLTESGAFSVQAAQTIHPSTSDQTISADKYLTGAQTIKGVLLTNLSAGNIKKDVVVKVGDSTDDDCVTSITGTYEGGGGGGNEDAILSRTLSGDYANNRITTLGASALLNCTSVTSVFFENVTSVLDNALQRCTSMTTAVFPKTATFAATAFGNDTALTTIDVGVTSRFGGSCFSGSTAFNTMVLRGTGITVLASTNAINNTCFASGKAGGTIYIPQSLYNHLGDNSALDYKAASNWATVQGYGTITWAKIEGSYYETHYADGTAI